MRVHRILIVSLMIVLAAGAVGADVKIVRAYHQDGFSMMGQNQPTTDEDRVTWIGDSRMRMDQGDTSTIVVLGDKKMYILNHDQKSYFEVELPIDLDALLPPGMGEQMMKMMQFDVTVTPMDETKKVGEWTAKRYDMKMKSAMVEVAAVLWASKDTPVDGDAYLGLFGEAMSLQPGMDKMVDGLRKIDGYVVAQESTMTMSMGGETTVASNERTKSIENADPPAGTYAPPADYTRKDFDYMKMMQR